MKLIDRYLLRSFARTFGLALGAFCGLYLLVEFFERVDDFMEHQAPAALYAGYFLSLLPSVAVEIAPLAVLLGVFLTLGGLSRRQELTALRAGGVGLARIGLPLLGAAMGLSLSLLAASEYVLPLSVSTANRILQQEVKGKPDRTLDREDFWLRQGPHLIHVLLAVPETGSLQGVSLLTVDDDFRLVSRIDAPLARFREEAWRLEGATVRRFDPLSGVPTAMNAPGEMRLELDLRPEDFTLSQREHEELSLRDLARLASSLQAEGIDPLRVRTDLQARVARPFATLILAFLAIPFALQRSRSSGLGPGLTLSLLIGISFHLCHAMLQTLGYAGILPPWLAAWAANLLFGGLGLWLLLSVRE